MTHETPEARELNIEEVDLNDVPDWHYEPGTSLTKFGRSIDRVDVQHEPRTINIDPEVQAIRTKVEAHQAPTFFNGSFANVENISLSENGVSIKTAETDFFTYLASAYAHRERVSANPIRPLAVQATLFSPDGSRLIIERRSEALADNPGKLSVFGGALKPNEQPNERIIEILNNKLGLNLEPDQVRASGLVRENIDNIYCLTYTVDLNQEQFMAGRDRAAVENRVGERIFYQISTDEARKSIEQMFRGKRPISEWDPNAYFNILYALGAKGKRTPEELQGLGQEMRTYMHDHPMNYTYPVEKYLPKSE